MIPERTIPEALYEAALDYPARIEVVEGSDKDLNLKPWRLRFGGERHSDAIFAPLFYYFETLGELSEFIHWGRREIVPGKAAQYKLAAMYRHAKDRSVDGTL